MFISSITRCHIKALIVGSALLVGCHCTSYRRPKEVPEHKRQHKTIFCECTDIRTNEMFLAVLPEGYPCTIIRREDGKRIYPTQDGTCTIADIGHAPSKKKMGVHIRKKMYETLIDGDLFDYFYSIDYSERYNVQAEVDGKDVTIIHQTVDKGLNGIYKILRRGRWADGTIMRNYDLSLSLRELSAKYIDWTAVNKVQQAAQNQAGSAESDEWVRGPEIDDSPPLLDCAAAASSASAPGKIGYRYITCLCTNKTTKKSYIAKLPEGTPCRFINKEITNHMQAILTVEGNEAKCTVGVRYRNKENIIVKEMCSNVDNVIEVMIDNEIVSITNAVCRPRVLTKAEFKKCIDQSSSDQLTLEDINSAETKYVMCRCLHKGEYIYAKLPEGLTVIVTKYKNGKRKKSVVATLAGECLYKKSKLQHEDYMGSIELHGYRKKYVDIMANTTILIQMEGDFISIEEVIPQDKQKELELQCVVLATDGRAYQYELPQ